MRTSVLFKILCKKGEPGLCGSRRVMKKIFEKVCALFVF